MDLWIRSQDGNNLIKINYLVIEETENRTYKYGDIGKPKEFAIKGNITLGIYSTKERALEVLDDIQWELSKRGLGQPNYTGIYEMPKE